MLCKSLPTVSPSLPKKRLLSADNFFLKELMSKTRRLAPRGLSYSTIKFVKQYHKITLNLHRT